MGVFEGTDAVWGLLGSSGRSSASQLGSPARRCSRGESMVVLPLDQPSAALEGVFHLGEDRKGWGWKDEPRAAGGLPCKSDCAGEGSIWIGLVWAVLGGNGRGRESWGCQATLSVYWEDKSHNNGKKGSFPRLLFASLFLCGSSRSDPAAAPGNNVTFSCSTGPRGLSLVMKTGIFGSAGAEGWRRQARPVLGGKEIVGKANCLSPDTSHSCTTCFWQTFCVCSFPVSKEAFCGPCSERGLRLVLGFAWIEVAPSAPGD